MFALQMQIIKVNKMLADLILIDVPVKITKMIFRFLSMITRKRYDLIYYHTLGRQFDLTKKINGIKFDASYKTPWLRAERLFTKEPDTYTGSMNKW